MFEMFVALLFFVQMERSGLSIYNIENPPSLSLWFIPAATSLLFFVLYYIFDLQKYCFSKKASTLNYNEYNQKERQFQKRVISGIKVFHRIPNHAIYAINYFFLYMIVSLLNAISEIGICECDYCGSFIHESCISKCNFHCKQLTSTKSEIKHLWYNFTKNSSN